MDATLRCFVGLALDEANSATLHERVTSVLDARDWKLHEREDYHLTLCFLGEIAAESLPTLRSNLAGYLRDMPSLKLTLRGASFFGEASSPRVLWADVAGSELDLTRLVALRRATAAAIEDSGLTWDSAESFTPHVTVARPRRRASLPEGFAALALDLAWSPTAATLFGSVPGARPHYPGLDSFALV
ncbi:MAG: RNA 2',3'-cyclic phosphodiesterase [Planctomycetota bacterium]|nr:RNA 2',3'-cyclic phosphodiesterase [Planctomycetota bacterium]